ncbi:hypothetical protein RV01_GL000902 [Enterococcus dispar]|nr:hypothetical protein RV01_GL000902 [Enterococcus dispar]
MWVISEKVVAKIISVNILHHFKEDIPFLFQMIPLRCL